MRLVLCILALLALLNAAQASVVVSQVLYDPINTESGGEAVELRNDGSSAVNISKWVLATESTPNDAVIPDNTFLEPAKHILSQTRDGIHQRTILRGKLQTLRR
jgi:P pilus assembly chaperone PapD